MTFHAPDPERSERLYDLFCQATDLDPDQRGAFCEAACGDDARLLEELRALLTSAEGVEAFLDQPALSADVLPELEAVRTDVVARARAAATDPEEIGPYRILQRLGAGGMGIVYLAEQQAPVQRRVALKVIKPGMDTEQVLRRFDAERQALARMDHPGIARIHDGGVTSKGRPYFVMEYVEGETILEACRQQSLSRRERLMLFCQLCDAVQHAHQKGILHRDLKPSNVLVTERDGQFVPVVIDFGIARAVSEPLTGATLTRGNEVVGTLEYAAPEQAAGGGVGLDSRADIYSLGVIFFELLTDRRPFDPHTPIHDREPSPPSKHGERALRGEPDWITLKAMDSDRERRYASASELAADVRRYLRDEPVSAGPPSASYRVRKFVRRYRTQVLAAGLALLALVAGGTVALFKMFEARALARDLDLALGRAETSSDVLIEWLSMINLENGPLSKRSMLDQIAADVETVFADRPRRHADVHKLVGEAYASIAENGLAIHHLGEALRIRESLSDVTPEELLDVLWIYQWPLEMTVLANQRDEVSRRVIMTAIEALRRHKVELGVALKRVSAASSITDPDIAVLDTRIEELLAIAERDLPDGSPHWLTLADALNSVLHRTHHSRRARHSASWVYDVIQGIYRDRTGLRETNTRRLLTPLRHLDELAYKADRESFLKGDRLAKESRELLDEVLPADHFYHALHRFGHGACRSGIGDLEGGFELLEQSLAIRRRGGDESAYSILILGKMIENREAWGDEDRARVLRDELEAKLSDTPTPGFPTDYLGLALGPDYVDLVEWIAECEARCKADGLLAPELLTIAEEARVAFREGRRTTLVAGCLLGIIKRTGLEPSEVALPLAAFCADACSEATLALAPESLLTLAGVQLAAGAYEEALTTLERRIDPPTSAAPLLVQGIAQLHRGRALSKLGRDGAEATLLLGYETIVKAVGLSEGNTRNAHRFVQEHYLDVGKSSSAAAFAEQRLRGLMAQFAGPADLHSAVRWLVLSPGADAQAGGLAVQASRRCCELDPDRSSYRIGLGASRLRQGDEEGALAEFARAEQMRADLEETNPTVLPALQAIALARLGRRAEAAEALVQARHQAGRVPGDTQLRSLVAEAEALAGME